MKTWLMSFLIILAASPLSELQTSFMTDIDQAYEQYHLIEDYTSSYYRLIVVEGVNKNEVTYGVLFFSEKAKEYTVKINSKYNTYKLKSNSRGDIAVISFTMAANFTIEVFDNFQKTRKTVEIIKTTKASLLENTDLIIGAGLGKAITHPQRSLETVDYIAIGGGIIIFIAALFILIAYKTKKGIFNPVARKAHTLFTTSLPQEAPIDDSSPVEIENKPQLLSQYGKTDEDEEERDYQDILISRGIPIEYTFLNPEEKNNVMLKLMFLRDQKLLTLAEYQREVIKLWKK